MSIIKVKDKTFKTSIPEAQILERVKAVADRINTDMADKNPLLLAMLNGSFIFAADLMRYINVPCEISFVKMSSYAGTSSTGNVKQLIGLNEDIKGRTVIVVEDIIESGLTMKTLLNMLQEKQPMFFIFLFTYISYIMLCYCVFWVIPPRLYRCRAGCVPAGHSQDHSRE